MPLPSISARSVVTQISSAWKNFDVGALRKHAKLLELVKSEPYEVEQVMGYLKHRKEEWVVIREEHPWHKIADSGAKTLLRHSFGGQFTFLFHLTSRWMLIVADGELIPAIFLFTDQSRDGLPISYYRLFGGVALAWLPAITELVEGITHVEPVKEVEHPYKELYKFHGG